MAYKINGTTVVDNSRNVCACCVTSCCITASDRMDAPSGNTASRPGSPATGSIYFDTDLGQLLSYNGTDWVASAATAVDAQDFGSPTWTYGTIDSVKPFCKSLLCCGCTGSHSIGDVLDHNPAAMQAQCMEGIPGFCYSCQGNCCGLCPSTRRHIYREGFGGSTTETCTYCGGYCSNQVIVNCTTKGGNVEDCGNFYACPLDDIHGFGRLQVLPNGSLFFKSKHVPAGPARCFFACADRLCAWNEAYVDTKGGMTLAKQVGHIVKPQCCTTQCYFAKEGFYYHPSYGRSTHLGPTIAYAMIAGDRPTSCNGNFFKNPGNVCFQICTNDKMFTVDEEVCDCGYILTCCASNHKPTVLGFSCTNMGCTKFKMCCTTGSKAFFNCGCCCNFWHFEHVLHTTSRTDHTAAKTPTAINPEIFTHSAYNCCGVCAMVPDLSCCPLGILSFINIGRTAGCCLCSTLTADQKWWWSTDGCCLNRFNYMCVCGLTSKIWNEATDANCCHKCLNTILYSKINVRTCAVNHYAYCGWACLLWWQCCMGFTYGTKALGCGSVDFLCYSGNQVFQKLACNRNDGTQSFSNPPTGCCDLFNNGRILFTNPAFGSGRGHITSCQDTDRHYFFGNVPNNRCTGDFPSTLPLVGVFCEATNNWACFFDFCYIIYSCKQKWGDWLNLHFSTPYEICTNGSTCLLAQEMCWYIGQGGTGSGCSTPHCCIAACVCAITGCNCTSLAHHCEGYNPLALANRSWGGSYNCHFVPKGVSSHKNMGIYLNPVTDHMVVLLGFGPPSYLCCCQARCFSWIGAVCFDLTNCCVSKVNVLYPAPGATMECYDNRIKTCGENYNPGRASTSDDRTSGSPVGCMGTANPWDSCSLGVSVLPYGTPHFTDYYGGDCGGVIVFNDSMHLYETGVLNCCCCLSPEYQSKYFGCTEILSCPEFQSRGYCCNKCVMNVASGGFLSRLPYNCPFECIGWRTSTFYKNVFTWMLEGTKTYDPFGSDKGCVARISLCNAGKYLPPIKCVHNTNTCAFNNCMKTCEAINLICEGSAFSWYCNSTFCADLGCYKCLFCCTTNWKGAAVGITLMKCFKPCHIGDNENTTKIYSRCIRSTNRKLEGTLYDRPGELKPYKPYKMTAGEDHGAAFLRHFNEFVACIC